MAKPASKRRVVHGFVKHLRKNKAFRQLKQRDQLELAHLIWCDHMKIREHQEEKDATSYTYQELEERFGRGRFMRINEQVDAFHVGRWDKDRGITRSFYLSPEFRVHKQSYLKKTMKQMEPNSFIDMKGGRVKALPRPISSKRSDGSTVKLWGDVEISIAVPVNVELLQSLYAQTWGEIKRIREKKASLSLFGVASELDMKRLEARATWAATLYILANTDLAGRGWIPMRYQEVDSGRLYAIETNLQNCPREVRMAALAGFLDYDISNCHYALLDQMAARAGFECDQIRYYLQNKKVVREQIAVEVGIEVEQVKTCLLAVIYGAAMSTSPLATFGEALGKEKARGLIEHPLFAMIAKEVKQAGMAVLEAAPKRSGSLMNAAGCGIRLNQNRRKKLAHLLQGAEAVILKAAVQFVESRQQGNVILLQHDGFTTRKPIPVAELEAIILQQTGYQASFECDPIQPSADLDFSKMMKPPKGS